MDVLCDSEPNTARRLADCLPSGSSTQRSERYLDNQSVSLKSSSTDSELGQLTSGSNYNSSEETASFRSNIEKSSDNDEESDEQESTDSENEEYSDEDVTVDIDTEHQKFNTSLQCTTEFEAPQLTGSSWQEDIQARGSTACYETESCGQGMEQSTDGRDDSEFADDEITNQDYSELIEKRFQKLYGLQTPVNCRVLDQEWCDQILPLDTRADCSKNMVDTPKKNENETSVPSNEEKSTKEDNFDAVNSSKWPTNYKFENKQIENLTPIVHSTIERSSVNNEEGDEHGTTNQHSENEENFDEGVTVEIDTKHQVLNTLLQCPTDFEASQLTDSSSWDCRWNMEEEQLDHPFRFLSLINKLATMNDLVFSTLLDTGESKTSYGFRRTPVEDCIIEEIFDECSDDKKTSTNNILNNSFDQNGEVFNESNDHTGQTQENQQLITAVKQESVVESPKADTTIQKQRTPNSKNKMMHDVSLDGDKIDRKNYRKTDSSPCDDSTNKCRTPSRKSRCKHSPRSFKHRHRQSKSDGDTSLHTKNGEPTNTRHASSGKTQGNKSVGGKCQPGGKKNRKSRQTDTKTSQGHQLNTRNDDEERTISTHTANNTSKKYPLCDGEHLHPNATKLPLINTYQSEGARNKCCTSYATLPNIEEHRKQTFETYKPRSRTTLRGLQNQQNVLLGKLLMMPPPRKQNGSTFSVRQPYLAAPAMPYKRSHPLAVRRPCTPPNRNILESRAQWPQFSTKLPCHTGDGISNRINFRDMPSLKKVPGFSYGVYEY